MPATGIADPVAAAASAFAAIASIPAKLAAMAARTAPIYCQCPHCLTVYRPLAQELAAGRGQARCGHCGEHFDALATLTSELPPEPIQRLALIEPAPAPPGLSQAVLRPRQWQPSLFTPGERPSGPGTRSAADNTPGAGPAPPQAPDDDFLRRHRPRQPSRQPTRWPWWLAAGSLALVLLAQVAWAERARLLGIDTYRQWAVSACAWLGCNLADPDTPQRPTLVMVSRDIRKHPNVEDALLINALISNRGEHSQPWPMLELRLSNLDERPMAMRRFLPRDYLSDPARISRGMAPDTTLPVELEVVDPGSEAVNFEFRLLPLPAGNP